MGGGKESVKDKLIVALIDTLIFGVLLLVFGHWLDVRLEKYKQELADQSEMTKSLLVYLDPHIQERRTAYRELLKAAKKAEDALEDYYAGPGNPTQHDAKEIEYQVLMTKLGAKGSGGSSGSWPPNAAEAGSIVNQFDRIREEHKDAMSPEVNSAATEFYDMLRSDLSQSVDVSNDNDQFRSAAMQRVRASFSRFKDQVTKALGLDKMPIL
jgi:hypothetical protein